MAIEAQLAEQVAWYRFLFAARRLERALKYNPNWQSQPRVPAGRPDGGRWTDGSGRAESGTEGEIVRLVQAEAGQGYRIDLLDEEAAGGHAIRSHVGRSPESLLARVRGEHYFGFIFEIRRKRDGSFPTVAAANRLVNATLSRNRSVVEAVAGGELGRAFVTAEFRSKTGIEAYGYGEHAAPRLRDTYGVGVLIAHDPNTHRRFRVVAA
ncbi:RNase A-like domain-containing protein [Nitratireductor thuwali]|uniref:Bacterial CdiA-CT RNAse A domain-containing protein n=1 Tax=Nitratireductor thuwali TaxID=2267699 RepID=A0ABY5MLR0_9HYPH|nr:hypothetical protein NTH_03394 [Nitratireductor thuwali]